MHYGGVGSVANTSQNTSRCTTFDFKAMAYGRLRIDLPYKRFFIVFKKNMLLVSFKKVVFHNLKTNMRGMRNKLTTP